MGCISEWGVEILAFCLKRTTDAFWFGLERLWCSVGFYTRFWAGVCSKIFKSSQELTNKGHKWPYFLLI